MAERHAFYQNDDINISTTIMDTIIALIDRSVRIDEAFFESIRLKIDTSLKDKYILRIANKIMKTKLRKTNRKHAKKGIRRPTELKSSQRRISEEGNNSIVIDREVLDSPKQVCAFLLKKLKNESSTQYVKKSQYHQSYESSGGEKPLIEGIRLFSKKTLLSHPARPESNYRFNIEAISVRDLVFHQMACTNTMKL